MKLRKYFVFIICALLPSAAFSQRNNVETEGMKFSQLLFLIDNFYVDTADIHTLTDKAIAGVLKELDPHSTYITADEVDAMNESVRGSFEGVGITYRMVDDTVMINNVLTGCPAEKAGILPGDKLIMVGNDTISGKGIKLSQVSKLVRGPRGTSVMLHIRRSGSDNLLLFNVERDKIPINSVDASFYVRPGVGYLKLNSFSMTTTMEVNEAISKLLATGNLKTLVVDLQGNGGGIMSAAVELANLFLPSRRLIVYSEGSKYKRQELYTHSAPLKERLQNVELYILTDEYSASASEIFAGAMQDWERATVVGRRTFGKGLIQRPVNLRDGSEVRLTIARYYTPSGRNIQKPYDAGAEQYHKDIELRYRHGEMSSADSVSFANLPKYKTLITGKTVYGGGGIFSDIFVPLDTMRYTPTYRKALASGFFFKEVNRYIETHRAELKAEYPEFQSFKETYTPDRQTISRIIAETDNNDPDSDSNASESDSNAGKSATDELARTENMLSLLFKASVAQSLYGMEYYYHVVAQINEPLNKVLSY